jgi:hypothetical protein
MPQHFRVPALQLRCDMHKPLIFLVKRLYFHPLAKRDKHSRRACVTSKCSLSTLILHVYGTASFYFTPSEPCSFYSRLLLLIKYCLLTLLGQARRAFYPYLCVTSYFVIQQSTVNLWKQWYRHVQTPHKCLLKSFCLPIIRHETTPKPLNKFSLQIRYSGIFYIWHIPILVKIRQKWHYMKTYMGFWGYLEHISSNVYRSEQELQSKWNVCPAALFRMSCRFRDYYVYINKSDVMRIFTDL